MATIPELPEKTVIYGTDLLAMDDGTHTYRVQWAVLLALLGTVSRFEVDPDTENYPGYIKLTLTDGSVFRVKPSDPDKQDKLTFDNQPTEGSDNPVKSKGIFTALGTKFDKENYIPFRAPAGGNAGSPGIVPAPVLTGLYLGSEGSWLAPDNAPAESSNRLITSGAVFAALLPILNQIASTYDSESTYTLGSYCTHDGGLYRCTTGITTAEEWDSSHWASVTVGEALASLYAQAESLRSAESIAYDSSSASHTAGSVAAELFGLGVDDEDQELAIQLILNDLLHRDALFDALSAIVTAQGSRLTSAEGNITSQGTRLTAAETNITNQGARITNLEGRASTAEGNIAKLLVRTEIETGNITLTNSQAFPFNDSQVTVPLVAERDNQNYLVDYEVTAAVGNVGDIIVSAKLVNGFKIEYTGSASSVTVKYQVLGGMA